MSSSDYFRLAHQTCIQLLSRREYSQQELFTKLTQQNIPSDIIDQCLNELVANNYQSDERFAEMFCRSRVNQRYGAKKITYELKQKGIDDSLITTQLATHDEQWLDNAMYLIEKKAPRGNVGEVFCDRKLKDKITRFLVGKGYDYATISLAFESLTDTYDT